VFVPHVLSVGAHTTLKERRSVINEFNNGKSLRKLAQIIQRSPSTVQDIIERYKNESRLTSKVRKIAKKVFTAYDERRFLRQIKNNTN
jgi:transposase